MITEEIERATDTAHILVVEDDEDTATFLHSLLADAGYTVTTVPDGTEALRQVRDRMPDLVLMDVMLPEMDGYTATGRIRAESAGTVPIIMLTASSQPSSKIRGFDAGADDFVVKPFSGPELLARIGVQIRRSQVLQELEDQSAFLERALDSMTRRHKEVASSFEIERAMRIELLRSVNLHLQSLCTVFDAEYRRQAPGMGREALQRVIPRLRSAALVYQIAEGLIEEIADFAAVLRTIASSIKSVYSPRKRIPISVDAPPCEIPSPVASPLAMVATELVTNAFKHAFPQSRFGAITVICTCDERWLLLEVADDGVGMDIESAGDSRGLTMARQMVGGLDGTLDLRSGPEGTRAVVKVPVTWVDQVQMDGSGASKDTH